MKFEQRTWNNTTRYALRDTFNGCEIEIRKKVQSGTAQVYLCDFGYLIIEPLPELREVFIWCFQGKHALQLWHVLAKVAGSQGFTHIGCFTRHKAGTWLFRKYNPQITENDGEYRIRIAVTEFDKYDCQGAISSTPYEKPVEPTRRSVAAGYQREHAVQSE